MYHASGPTPAQGPCAVGVASADPATGHRSRVPDPDPRPLDRARTPCRARTRIPFRARAPSGSRLASRRAAQVRPTAQVHVAIPAVDLAVAVEVGAHAHHAALLEVLPAIGLPALGAAAAIEIALGAQRLALVEEDLGVDLAVVGVVELL